MFIDFHFSRSHITHERFGALGILFLKSFSGINVVTIESNSNQCLLKSTCKAPDDLKTFMGSCKVGNFEWHLNSLIEKDVKAYVLKLELAETFVCAIFMYFLISNV